MTTDYRAVWISTDLANIVSALEWADRFFKHRDEMNAAVHCDEIRWSEVTQRVSVATKAALRLEALPPGDSAPFRRLAELWREQLGLGTTQGGGRRYEDHCRQHEEARALLQQIDGSDHAD